MLMQSEFVTFEAIGALVVVLDVDGCVAYWNRACSELTGYSLDEIRGRRFWEVLLIPEEAQAVRTVFASLRAGAHPAALSNYWVCRNGERRWIAWSNTSINGPDGRLQYFVKTGIDRTERKEAEDRLSGIISGAIDAVISIDHQQRIVLYNRGAEQIFGWTAAEVMGKSLNMLLPERFRAGHGNHVRSFGSGVATALHMAEGRPEIFGLRRNGEEFPAQASISKIDVSGHTMFTVVLRDVTEQRQREKEREFLLELGTILESSLDYDETLTSIARLSVNDFADCCIVDVFDQVGKLRRMKLLHRDPSKMTTCEILQRIPVEQQLPKLTSSTIASKESLLIPEVSTAYLESVAQNDEDLRALQDVVRSLIVVPLLVRGEPLGAIAFVSSHPERRYGQDDLRLAEELAYRSALAVENARLYERALRLAADLREANEHLLGATSRAQELKDVAETARKQIEESERELRAAGELREMFIGIVGHDLRNPLGAINMSAQVLAERGHLDALDTELVARIERSSQRMSRMITQLLDLTRIRLAGGIPLDLRRADLREVCHKMVGEFATPTTLRIDGDVSGIWDSDRLEEALSNIMGNAIEHAAPGTAVLLEVHPDGEQVLVSISNQGPPIPPDVLPHIFEPFRRAKQREKSARGNLGLGLYIAYQIVIAHGGTLEPSSSNGTTTFKIRIPRTQLAQQTRNGYQRVELSDAFLANSP